jgi:hypothetical protein
MEMGVIGLAVITRTPITGALISRLRGCDEAMTFSGAAMCTSSVLLLSARLMLGQKRVWAAWRGQGRMSSGNEKLGGLRNEEAGSMAVVTAFPCVK